MDAVNAMTALEARGSFADGRADAVRARAERAARGGLSVERARRVGVEFEAMFLSQMLQPMFKGLDAEEPFGGGHAETMWRSLMVDEYGKAMAESRSIGIADAVQRELLRAQEGR